MNSGIFKTAQNLETKEVKGLGRSKALLKLFPLLSRPCGSMQNSELTHPSCNMRFLKGKESLLKKYQSCLVFQSVFCG